MNEPKKKSTANCDKRGLAPSPSSSTINQLANPPVRKPRRDKKAPEEKLARALVLLLRFNEVSGISTHNMNSTALMFPKDGFFTIDMLMKRLPKIPYHNLLTEDVIKSIADADTKGRFEISANAPFAIRACQGYGMKVGITPDKYATLQTNRSPIKVAYHGTTHSACKKIIIEGLSPVDRRCIHAAKTTDASSGLRTHSQVIIRINIELLIKDGIPVYLSKNGVVLIDPPAYENGIRSIAPKYFSLVTHDDT
jgi:RNA:NAD 2'-phosphotransferase (TPT1/KptA family)